MLVSEILRAQRSEIAGRRPMRQLLRHRDDEKKTYRLQSCLFSAERRTVDHSASVYSKAVKEELRLINIRLSAAPAREVPSLHLVVRGTVMGVEQQADGR
jgi:hypothetical protein